MCSTYLHPEHGCLRVREQVHECVDAVALVVADGSHRLLAHGALVRVARRLVVVRVRYEAGADAEDGEWFDLQVRRVAV